MKSFTIISAYFLCNLSWISVSGSESQTVEVQSGKNVTLPCSNISTSPTQTDWFRVTERTKPICISSMYGSDGKPSPCDGFQNGKFKMSSNISTVFLQIKGVDLSDSGLYFCGFYMNRHTVISTATDLKVQGDVELEVDYDLGVDYDLEVEYNGQNESDGMANLMSMILGGLTVLLTIIIIVLGVKIRKLQSAVSENRQLERNKNPDSDELNYAALTFQAKAKRNRRPASDRELVPNVVYAATR